VKAKLPFWLSPSTPPPWKGEVSTIDNGVLRRSGGNKFLVPRAGDAWSAQDQDEIVEKLNAA
jgi:hypothetical protein